MNVKENPRTADPLSGTTFSIYMFPMFISYRHISSKSLAPVVTGKVPVSPG